MKAPDFVIAGGHRSGTQFLGTHLAAHPKVFFSPLKEPNFFCTDAPGLRVISEPEAYANLFRAAKARQLRGEGSACYLFSHTALPAVLENNPKTKIIVSVRNPLEMLVSLHSQKVYAFEENERDFVVAWKLSDARAEGRAVGPTCRAPQYLDYRGIGRLGEQVQRAKHLIPASQLHIIVFDDIKAAPASVYRDLLRFLDLDEGGPTHFARVNERRAHALPALGRFLMRPPGFLQSVKRQLRQAFPAQAKALGGRIHGLNRRAPAEQTLSPELRREMADAFADDVALLSRLLNRDLSHWLSATETPERSAAGA